MNRIEYIGEGRVIYKSMDEVEKLEHQEVAAYIRTKAGIAYDLHKTEITCFCLGCNPRVISSLVEGKFPVERTEVVRNGKMLRVKVMPNDLKNLEGAKINSSWCSIL